MGDNESSYEILLENIIFIPIKHAIYYIYSIPFGVVYRYTVVKVEMSDKRKYYKKSKAALFWASRDNLRGRFNFSNTVSVSGPKQHFSRTFFENKHGAKFKHEKHL